MPMLDPDMPADQLRLMAGEMTAQEIRTARAFIRLSNAAALEALTEDGVVSAVEEALWGFLFNGAPSINSRTHAAKTALTAAANALKEQANG